MNYSKLVYFIMFPTTLRILDESAGIEPAGAGDGTSKNNWDSSHSTEALIKILTNPTDENRQIPTHIVERWGSLSDELKRAVLRVVG